MAETQQVQGKRQRDEIETLIAEEMEEPKRRKSSSYNQILSFLDEDEEEDQIDDTNQDVSSIFTTLQRELSFDDPIIIDNIKLTTAADSGNCPGSDLGSAPIKKSKTQNAVVDGEEEDDDDDEEEDRLMKRLLEATDDELGIPNGGPPAANGGSGNGNDGLVMDGGDEFGLLSSCGGLWELEDEAANYYTWFQSELFM